MSAETLFLSHDADGQSMRIVAGKVEELTAHESSAPHDALTLDCGDGLIGPVDVNAHTHLYSGLAPLGMPAPEPAPQNFVQILERVWWRLDRALDEASLRASARFYVAEALLAGTGALVDHHESPNLIEGSLDILADACQDLGMRAVLCYGATERNGGREEARRGLAECRRFIAQNTRPLVRGVVALHASFTVSDETIVEAAALCRELDTVLHVHLAEDGADVADAQARGYQDPLDRLQKLGALRPGTILVHGVHLSAEQVGRAREQGCWLVQNPRSNRGNRVGYSRFLGHSDRVALGTDGYPSRMNDELVALIEEATQRREKLCDVCRRPERGRELMAERFHAPLGADPGDHADVAVLTSEPQAVRVRHLVVDGVLAVRDGVLVCADIDGIRHEAEEQAAKLWERMRAL